MLDTGRRTGLLMVGALAGLPPDASAQQPVLPPRPAFHALPSDDDWSALRDPRLRTEWWDRLKYVPLAGSGRVWLSLGGDTRVRYEAFRNPLFGADPPDRGGYLLQRYRLHADFRIGGRVRTYVEVQSAFVSGRTGGPRALDENQLDLHQAFVDVALDRDADVVVRLGRHELDFGSSRLVSAREMVNVRQSFSGARVLARGSTWRGSAWLVRPLTIERGAFDDSPDPARTLWGLSWVGMGRPERTRRSITSGSSGRTPGSTREPRTSGGTWWVPGYGGGGAPGTSTPRPAFRRAGSARGGSGPGTPPRTMGSRWSSFRSPRGSGSGPMRPAAIGIRETPTSKRSTRSSRTPRTPACRDSSVPPTRSTWCRPCGSHSPRGWR